MNRTFGSNSGTRGRTRVKQFAGCGAAALAILSATAVTVGGPTGVHAGDGDNHLAVSVASNPAAVSSGDDVQYIVTVTNKNTTSNSGALMLTDSIACSPSSPCGHIISASQSGGPESWSCGVPSGTSVTCSLPGGMANQSTDTFSVIAQTDSGAARTMTDTAEVSTVDTGGATASTGAATTTVGSSSDTSGGTTTGFCPSNGCTISSGSEPTSNGTVGRIAFPAFGGSGFTYSFTMGTGTFCSPTSLVPCTGLTMSTGPLAGPNPGQTFTSTNPVTITLVYGAGITPTSLNTPLVFKSSTSTGPGTQIASCGTTIVTPCAKAPSRDAAGSLVVTILMSSHDPWVGSIYIP